MRILHVLHGLRFGGIEELALQLIAHSPDGFQCELLNTDCNSQEQAAAVAKLLGHRRLAAMHQWLPCDGPWLAWRSFRISRRRRPDALLIYPCNRPMLWLALGARLAGVRKIAVHLGSTAPADPAGRKLLHRLLLLFQRLGVVSVPCTQAIANSLQPMPHGLHLGPVIANGCDVVAIADRAEAARRRRPAGDTRRVLMVARLDPIKNHAILLRAFADARDSDWQLQLVGDGPDRPRLEALAREQGLDPEQVFLGRRSDIPELLGQADLFAFPTLTEGFGIVLIEAMAAGLPIIASDVPACREVLKDGAAGELLPPVDVAAWAERLAELMGSSARLQALAVRAHSHAACYDICHTANQWYQLLSSRSSRVLP